MTCRVLTFNPKTNVLRFPAPKAEAEDELEAEIREAVQKFFAYRKQWVDPPSDGEWGRAG